MNIAITGASGFIGEKLSWYLQRSGSDVIALVRSKEKEKNLNKIGLRTRVCDITNVSSLKDAFQGINIVVHLAALFNNPEASWDYYHLVNVEGTRNVLETAVASNIERVIHCSTIGVAIGNGHLPYSEKTPYSPASWDKYEVTKCMAEKLAIEYNKNLGLPVVIIRPAQVYGPGDSRKAKFYRMVKKGIIVNPGKTVKHLIYIDDLCRAFQLAMGNDKAIGEVYIIAGERTISMKELILLAAQELGVPPPKIVLPATPITWACAATENLFNFMGKKPPLFRRSMDFFTKTVEFDTSKARMQLGFSSTVSVRDGVRETISWYRENGYL